MPYRIIQVLLGLLVVIAGITLFNSSAIALPTTVDFRWVGKKGYLMQGTFTYSEDTTNLRKIEQKSQGQFHAIENLIVSFYAPSGKKLKTYQNIKNHIADSPYFHFDFDREQHKIYGEIDLGGDTPGEIYLKGLVDKNLALFEIDSSGKEHILDQNLGQSMKLNFSATVNK